MSVIGCDEGDWTKIWDQFHQNFAEKTKCGNQSDVCACVNNIRSKSAPKPDNSLAVIRRFVFMRRQTIFHNFRWGLNARQPLILVHSLSDALWINQTVFLLVRLWRDRYYWALMGLKRAISWFWQFGELTGDECCLLLGGETFFFSTFSELRDNFGGVSRFMVCLLIIIRG